MGSTCSSNRTSESLQYRTEVYDPASLPWRRIRADVLRIERQQFGAGAFSVEYLEHEFVGARNTVVLLWCEDLSRLVGFTYALPVDEMDPSRGSESRITAYVGDTALDEEHQGKRLVARLMDCLERELRRKGVQFLERDAW